MEVNIINSGKKIWRDKTPESAEEKRPNKNILCSHERLFTGVSDFIPELYLQKR